MDRRGFLGLLLAAALPKPTATAPRPKLTKARSQTVSVGDVITIAGRYMVNPATRRETDILRLFVITGVVASKDGPRVLLFPPDPSVGTKVKLEDLELVSFLGGKTFGSATTLGVKAA